MFNTNIPGGAIYDTLNSTSLILNATESYDPEDLNDNLTCSWEYPNGNQTVKVDNGSCVLEVMPTDIIMVRNTSISEVREFKVNVSSALYRKNTTKSIFITVLSS